MYRYCYKCLDYVETTKTIKSKQYFIIDKQIQEDTEIDICPICQNEFLDIRPDILLRLYERKMNYDKKQQNYDE